MSDDEIRSLFREMREEAVPADSLARVRLAVAARTQEPQPKRWGLPLLIAACCAIAIVCVMLLRPVPPLPPVPPPISARQVPPPEVRALPDVKPVLRPVHHLRAPQPPPGTVVRIETNDPNVVILLVSD